MTIKPLSGIKDVFYLQTTIRSVYIVGAKEIFTPHKSRERIYKSNV